VTPRPRLRLRLLLLWSCQPTGRPPLLALQQQQQESLLLLLREVSCLPLPLPRPPHQQLKKQLLVPSTPAGGKDIRKHSGEIL
jgi:hypothetical protein